MGIHPLATASLREGRTADNGNLRIGLLDRLAEKLKAPEILPAIVLAADLDELSTLRRAAFRRARDGACVLLRGAFLCAAGHRGRDVHAAARTDPGVCFNDAGVDVLRRIDRKAREKAQGKKGEKIPQRNGCLKKEVKLP